MFRKALLVLAALSAILVTVFSFSGNDSFKKNVLDARSYKVYVPDSLSSSESLNVYVVLHGSGGTALETSESSGFNSLADKEGFITIYPQGLGLVPDWNGGGCCGSSVTDQIDDVSFIESLILKMETDYAVKHVYVVGFSSGGVMAYRVGCELSNIVSGVGVHSGSLAVPSCSNESKTPLLHIHGTVDDVVPIDGGVGPDLYDFRSLEKSVDLFGQSGAYTETVKVEGLSHSWSPDAAETFVKFFKQSIG